MPHARTIFRATEGTKMKRKLLSILIFAALCVGCSTVYYNTMEKFGVH